MNLVCSRKGYSILQSVFKVCLAFYLYLSLAKTISIHQSDGYLFIFIINFVTIYYNMFDYFNILKRKQK